MMRAKKRVALWRTLRGLVLGLGPRLSENLTLEKVLWWKLRVREALVLIFQAQLQSSPRTQVIHLRLKMRAPRKTGLLTEDNPVKILRNKQLKKPTMIWPWRKFKKATQFNKTTCEVSSTAMTTFIPWAAQSSNRFWKIAGPHKQISSLSRTFKTGCLPCSQNMDRNWTPTFLSVTTSRRKEKPTKPEWI